MEELNPVLRISSPPVSYLNTPVIADCICEWAMGCSYWGSVHHDSYQWIWRPESQDRVMDMATLRSLRLVSRVFNESASRCLFRQFRFPPDEILPRELHLLDNLSALADSAHRRRLRKLDINFPQRAIYERGSVNHELRDFYLSTMGRFESFMRVFDRLESLRLCSPMLGVPDLWPTLPNHWLDLLANVIFLCLQQLSATNTTLRDLHLELPYTGDIAHIMDDFGPPPTAILGRLEHLSITICNDSGVEYRGAPSIRKIAKAKADLEKFFTFVALCGDLKSLSLCCCKNPNLDRLDSTKLKHLEYLRLESFSCTLPYLRKLIERSAPHLQRVYLRHISLVGSGTWRAVFRQLRTDLPCLREVLIQRVGYTAVLPQFLNPFLQRRDSRQGGDEFELAELLEELNRRRLRMGLCLIEWYENFGSIDKAFF